MLKGRVSALFQSRYTIFHFSVCAWALTIHSNSADSSQAASSSSANVSTVAGPAVDQNLTTVGPQKGVLVVMTWNPAEEQTPLENPPVSVGRHLLPQTFSLFVPLWQVHRHPHPTNNIHPFSPGRHHSSYGGCPECRSARFETEISR